MIARLVSLAIGYACGNFIAGFLLGEMKGVDIRKKGSGNVGATNTLRSLGKGMGAIALFCDILKSFIACAISYYFFGKDFGEGFRLLFFYAGAGTVLGHDYPVYMVKKGGKGVAATAGMALVAAPLACPISAAIFFLTVCITKFVSLGSILMELAFLVQVVLFGELGILNLQGNTRFEAYIITALLVGLGIYKHRENIKRLRSGTENRISFKKREGESK